MLLSSVLNENIQKIHQIFPIKESFDFMTRDLFLGSTKAFWIGINGMTKADLLQQLFSDLQNPMFTNDDIIKDLQLYMNSKVGYIQAELCNDWQAITKHILSGPSVLFVDGFSQAIIIDTRSYPTRSVSEPETEKVTRGSKDGFVETLVFNSALIRRRIRNPQLTFKIKAIGTDSKTDIAISYINESVDTDLLQLLIERLDKLQVTSLTMGSKSLDELLVKRNWLHPFPSFFLTERPDVACSYLLEGHIVIIVDNSPSVLILPCTIFQFTQSPEDYYKSPAIGSYFRLLRFSCILLGMFLLPTFLLFGANPNLLPISWQPLTTQELLPLQLFLFVLLTDLFLDLYKSATALAFSGFSSSLAIIGGLIISDVSIQLNWANLEVLFYGATTLLTTLALPSVEFADGIRVYRLFLILCTGLLGVYGFSIGTIIIFISIATTPTFGGKSYFWPLFPFNFNALKTLLLRFPTTKAQPSKIWSRTKKK